MVGINEFSRTMRVKDIRACVFDCCVSICSCDSTEIYDHGTVDDIPFVFWDCRIAGLTCSLYPEEAAKIVCPSILICIES